MEILTTVKQIGTLSHLKTKSNSTAEKKRKKNHLTENPNFFLKIFTLPNPKTQYAFHLPIKTQIITI